MLENVGRRGFLRKIIGAGLVAATTMFPSASASKDSNGLTHVSVVNIDDHKTQTITVNFKEGYKQVTGRILTSPHVQDHNTFDDPEKVKPTSFAGATLNDKTLEVKLPPASVVVLELK